MKILVLTSGGDSPGMNMILASLQREFKDNLFACVGGFKGLIEGNILPIDKFNPIMHEKEAGSCIKCSRCLEFKTSQGFEKGLVNAKNFDVVIVLGGNGSYTGCCRLNERGVRTIFIPATIDNDVAISEYSQGFDTAVKSCEMMIENIMPTMEAFNRCAIFEVMGRHSPKIAKALANNISYDYLILNKEDIDYKKITEIARENTKNHHASLIIIKERLIKLSSLIKNLSKIDQTDEYKGVVVGYVQRGTQPTKKDLKFARNFAQFAINLIKNSEKSGAIIYKNKNFDVLYTNL